MAMGAGVGMGMGVSVLGFLQGAPSSNSSHILVSVPRLFVFVCSVFILGCVVSVVYMSAQQFSMSANGDGHGGVLGQSSTSSSSSWWTSRCDCSACHSDLREELSRWRSRSRDLTNFLYSLVVQKRDVNELRELFQNTIQHIQTEGKDGTSALDRPSRMPVIHGRLNLSGLNATRPAVDTELRRLQQKYPATFVDPSGYQPTNDDIRNLKLVFWSTDFHITPIADLKYLLKEFGVTVIDKSLSGHCHFKGTCAQDLKVITKDNGYDLGNEPFQLAARVFDAYKNDPQFEQVDAVVCFHPICTCMLYMALNKSVVAISSTRYEHGQEAPEQWRRFNGVIQKWASSPRNIVAGNSYYDAEYLRYFTGVPATFIPSFCGEITARYNPIKRSFLLGHMHVPDNKNSQWNGHSLVWKQAVQWMVEARDRKAAAGVAGAASLEFVDIKSAYPGKYEYQDLANHPAIIHLPYQVSVMSFFEQYRMNLPLLYPSLEFLTLLHLEHAVVSERTWPRIRGRGAVLGSDIERHPDYPVAHDPNNERSPDAVKYWLKFSDFYYKPHIILYDSWDDLIDKLLNTDFQEVSRAMQLHNQQFEKDLKQQWRNLLWRMFKDRPAGGYAMPQDFGVAMKELWGM